MGKPEKPFNNDEHEKRVAERYVKLARYDAFDKLVDMALDGVVEMRDAQTAWESEVITTTRSKL